MRAAHGTLISTLRSHRGRAVAVIALLAALVLAAALFPYPGQAEQPARQPDGVGADAQTGDPAAAASTPAAAADRLLSGERLRAGESIGTGTGSHRLAMEPNGDAVLYAGTAALWSTGTGGNAGASLTMDAGGELTVHSADGAELWSNGASAAGARLVVKPDGRLYEISEADEAVWSTPAPSYLAGAAPYVNPNSPAAVGARQALAAGRVDDAALLEKAAAQASARWLSTGDSIADVEGRTRGYAAAAAAAGQTPVFVAYAIPDRDCGNHSAGGFSVADYREWSAAVARGLEGSRAVMIVEPDSLLHVYKCGDSDERFDLLRQVSAAYAAAGAEVYLDGATSNSFGQGPKPLADIAARLEKAGVDRVAGFATNVSNFQTVADERAYANKLSGLLGGAQYVIDTSRNGNGGLRDASGGIWCNPPGRALGERPGATSDGAHVANLWVKTVGLSDGACNGGPAAGTYWEKYLLELAANAPW